jgi:hypothetical protein
MLDVAGIIMSSNTLFMAIKELFDIKESPIAMHSKHGKSTGFIRQVTTRVLNPAL